MATVNEDLADATIAERLRLLRYESGAVRDVLRAYEAAVREPMRVLVEYHKRLKAGDDVSPIERAQIERLQERLTEDVREARAAIEAEMRERLTETAEATAATSVGNLRAAVPGMVGVEDVAIGDAVTALMDPIGGNRWTARLAVDLVEVHDALQAVLAQAAIEGQSVPELAKRIQAATNLASTYRGRMVSIARTEIQRVSNDAAMRSYLENASVIKGVQYLATLDSRTCVVCAPDHNKVFMFVNGQPPPDMPQIPRHPRCRCFYAPVTKSWRELGVPLDDPAERRRMNGNLAENTTFDAWLKRQKAGVRREVLGSDAALAAFDAGVPLDRFTDNGKPLKVGELRALLADR